MANINWNTFFFLLFALVACGAAIAVVVSSNIVRMAVYLILSLGAAAGLFFLAGADFVGAMQLLIYVGGTLVLLIFGVMLTAQVPFISMRTRGGDWILAALVGGSLLGLLLPAAVSVPAWRTGAPAESAGAALSPAGVPLLENTATPLGMALLGVRTEKLDERPAPLGAGLSGYLLPFEIVSVHLLVVLVGASYLARTKRRARSP